VGVEAEELADDLDGQHLAVREHRHRAALAQPAIVAEVADEVVHEAEHGDDQGLQVHGRPSPRQCRREERAGATGAPSTTFLLENPHTGLATRAGRAPGQGFAASVYLPLASSTSPVTLRRIRVLITSWRSCRP